MTGRPDPTPEHPPERITDWAAYSAAQARALHPEPTDADTKRLRDAVFDDQWNSVTLPVPLVKFIFRRDVVFLFKICDVLHGELTTARADATRLRERARLTEGERAWVERTREKMMRTGSINSVYASDLLDIIARLTTHDTAPDGDREDLS